VNHFDSLLANLTSFLAVMASPALASGEPPREWVEAQTGHCVMRLSREPGSESLYFHQNGFSADGKKLVIKAPGGISTVNLDTREIDLVVPGRARLLLTGRKTGHIYFIRDEAVWAANMDSHEVRRVTSLPKDLRGSNVAVNCDETIIVGLATDINGRTKARNVSDDSHGGRLLRRWSAGSPMVIYTINIATGETKIIHRSNDWLNHLQCSPTDPQQILFCHEGPWHLVDRVWLVRTDGSDLRLVHPRTMSMEIAGHEFFGPDGRTIWYDLQTPRSEKFWLAGYEFQTGARTWYHLNRPEWSVHYNVSPDGKLFAGDGGGPHSVANQARGDESLDHPANGQWIYLFRPQLKDDEGLRRQAPEKTKVGIMRAERLVDLSNHDYELEPNVMFTRDSKWIVFRSNMHGSPHVYAVEVAPSTETKH
jgi:oligogalacturonide lyase